MTEVETKQRLDNLLVAHGLSETRSRARDLIKRGVVRVNGFRHDKPARMTREDAVLEITGGAGRYVSRGAEKLIAGLDAFGFDPAGLHALDAGASTGGFTQVLLERGAAIVTAVDVGKGQLHASLKSHPRVRALERTDARSLTTGAVPQPVSAITADVSFISLTKALPAVLTLAAPGCWLVALIKPQFEAGPRAVGKGGVVRGAGVRKRAVERVRDWLAGQPGWKVAGVIESPVTGADGNIEYLIGAKLND